MIRVIILIGTIAMSSVESFRVFDMTPPRVTPDEQQYIRLLAYESFKAVSGHLTNHKLVAPIQQLQCVGANCGDEGLVTSITCKSYHSSANPKMVGSSNGFEDDEGNHVNPEEHVMVCMAENLDPQYKLINIEISCEGFLDPVHIYEIQYVLLGSCGVTYKLGLEILNSEGLEILNSEGPSDVTTPKTLAYIYHMSHTHLLHPPHNNQFIATHSGSFSSRCHSATWPAPCAPEIVNIVNTERKDSVNHEL
jgi:hypothetical protein